MRDVNRCRTTALAVSVMGKWMTHIEPSGTHTLVRRRGDMF